MHAAILARALPIVCFEAGSLAAPMLGRKRDRAGRSLHDQFRNLIADNAVAAATINELTTAVRDVAPGALPKLPRTRSGSRTRNHLRDYARAFLRGSIWPRVYWARVRFTNVRTNRIEPQWLAFALPHEYVQRLHRLADTSALTSTSGLDPLTERHLRTAEAQAGIPLLPLGLWGDGAPTQWDREESIETFSLNLPGQAGEYKQLRLPLVAFAKKHICEHTWSDVCEILAWSFQILATGIAPVHRHDNSPWLASDRWRQSGHPDRASAPAVPMHACLCEVRADWVFHTAVFRLPAHNRAAGNCWLCPHTPAQVAMLRRSPRGPPHKRLAKQKKKEMRAMCLLHVHTHCFFVTPGPRGGLGCTLEDNTSGPHGCAFSHSSTGRHHQPFAASTLDPSHVLQARLAACRRPRGGCRFHRQCLIHIAAVLPRPIARCTSRLPEHMDATVV